jgi:hypothetical protein
LAVLGVFEFWCFFFFFFLFLNLFFSFPSSFLYVTLTKYLSFLNKKPTTKSTPSSSSSSSSKKNKQTNQARADASVRAALDQLSRPELNEHNADSARVVLGSEAYAALVGHAWAALMASAAH